MIPGWLEEIMEEVSDCLAANGGLSARDLAARLGVSERAAVEYISILAAKGRVTIDRVSLSGEGPASATCRIDR
jgi:hypothetical protein